MPRRSAPIFSLDDFTEPEIKVIAEAIREFIDHREEGGDGCDECNSYEWDDDGETGHADNCPVTIAMNLQSKLGQDAP
jgi:hypothetical protein